MRRKEVLVAAKVFTLGMEKMTEAADPEKGKTVTLDLDVGPTVFTVGVSQPDRSVILHWAGLTNVQNISWNRFVVLSLKWPPMQSMSCYVNTEEVKDVFN